MVFDTQQDFDIETTPVWIKAADCPYDCEITAVEPVKGKYGIDVRLTLNREKSFDVWGANKNKMITMYGKAPTHWVGKIIRIEMDGKNRTIEFPQL